MYTARTLFTLSFFSFSSTFLGMGTNFLRINRTVSVRPIKRAAFIYRPVLEITVLLLKGYFCEITVGYLKGDLDFPEGPLTLVPNDERFMLEDLVMRRHETEADGDRKTSVAQLRPFSQVQPWGGKQTVQNWGPILELWSA